MLRIWNSSTPLRAAIALFVLAGSMAASGWAQQAAAEEKAAREAAARAQQDAVRAEMDAKRAVELAHAAMQGGVAVAAPDAADGQARAYVWANRKGKKEKAAFLGVTTIAADAALRDQLKLPRGIGLVVQSVEENSPAATSGLVEHDILTKIDDQWLINAPQFGVVVRMHKPGDEIGVTLIRQGASQTVKAKLAEKEIYIADNDGTAAPFIAGTGGFSVNLPQIADLHNLEKLQGNAFWKAVAEDDDADIVIKDNDRTMKIKVRNGEKQLAVTDNDDKVLFEGPIETEEQRKALPADIAAELEKYNDQIDQLKDAGGAGHRKKIRIIKDGR